MHQVALREGNRRRPLVNNRKNTAACCPCEALTRSVSFDGRVHVEDVKTHNPGG